MDQPIPEIDAATFQSQTAKLAETIAQKVLREGRKYIAGPEYVTFDLFIIVRHALWAYQFFGFVNSDDIRKSGSWHIPYTVHAFGVIRTIIDCLYNVVAILADPVGAGELFRLSGLIKRFKVLDDERREHARDPKWTKYLDDTSENLRLGTRVSGFDPDAMPTGKHKWPTIGQYIGDNPASDTPIKSFLRNFTLGAWREYSQVSHAAFEGLTLFGYIYTSDLMPHEKRYVIPELFPRMMSMHYARAALLLLCIVVELQAYCRFDGARINERIFEIWDALGPVYETRELLSGRYTALMQAKGIARPKVLPSGIILP